jgi:hypothetical protein
MDLRELKMIRCEVSGRLGSRLGGCCFSWSPYFDILKIRN